tara:strand:+ start:213 stop:1391 length:1179 start_codon:yes stop_codon:yes gene_type:complete
MSIEIKVPTLGESITEATVSKWLKKEGEKFDIDEPLVEIETDKITLEVSAPSAGILEKINVDEGTNVNVGGVLGLINESNVSNIKNVNKKEKVEEPKKLNDNINTLSPSVKKIVQEQNIDTSKITLSRSDKRITKSDVINYLDGSDQNKTKTNINEESKKQQEEIVPMSKIRQTIALRLKDAQNTSAILTTFNEVDMSEIIKIRDLKKNDFLGQYGVKLGYMSFFVKATIIALKEYPAVNAEIKDDNIIFKNYFHIGIAVGTESGLVVPVIKNANKLNFGQTEKIINDLSIKAREGKLSIDDLSNGTFTISNGGVYGSMLSTPILNRPQSGILGMHNIVKRPVVVDNKIVIRPIMYLAFSYDHRLIDGKEAVGFLVSIKESLENPSELVLGF